MCVVPTEVFRNGKSWDRPGNLVDPSFASVYKYAVQGLSNADCPGCGRKTRISQAFFVGRGEEPEEMLINFLYYPFMNVRIDRFRIRVLNNETVLKVILILGMDLHLFKNLGRNRWCLAHAPAPMRKMY
jgi:hypothetical protein